MSRFARLWQDLPEGLRTYLEGVDLTAASALTTFVKGTGGADAAFEVLAADGDLAADFLSGFTVLAAAAVAEGKREMDRVSAATPADIIVQVEGVGGARLRETFPSEPIAPKVVKEGDWPAKRYRMESTFANPRKDTEAIKREIAVGDAVAIVREARLPLLVIAEKSSDPQAALRRVAQGRRFRTIQKRVSTWRKVRAWLLAAHGIVWPTEAGQVIEYLEERAKEPCPRSVLWSVLVALTFFERGGGVPEADQISKDPLVKAAIMELAVQIGVDQDVRRRKAPQLPFAVLLSWEDAVVDTARPTYDRMFAWWQAVRTWASLRFDDHRGLVPSEMRLVDGSLRAVLTRTKTTGHDKNVEALPVHVAKDAYLHHPGWLTVGFKLWEATPADRDFFLLLPDATREATLRIEATYADAMAMNRAMFASMSVIKVAEGEIVEKDCERLMDPATIPFWTEHSPRPTLPSWVNCLGVFPSDWPELLGRWGATGAENYVRTHRQRVHKMQSAVAQAFKDLADPHETFDEELLFDAIRDYLVGKNFPKDAIEEQVSRLRVKVVVGTPAGLGWDALSPQTDEMSDGEQVRIGTVSELKKCTPDDGKIEDGTYVITTAMKGHTRRRLHQVGRCWRRPGIDYHQFEVHGTTAPEDCLYSSRCRLCWPPSSTRPPSSGGPFPSSSSSSSLSSS